MPEKDPKTESEFSRRQFMRATTAYGLTTATRRRICWHFVVGRRPRANRQGRKGAQEGCQASDDVRDGLHHRCVTLLSNHAAGFQREHPEHDQWRHLREPCCREKTRRRKVLANKVQKGIIQVAQHSISNFAPFAPAADLINIPYWCAENQAFVNLVTSDAWKQEIDPKLQARGFKALWYASTSARTFSVRKGKDPILSPADMKGIKFRVPGSKMLQQFYRLLGANPTPVAWGETPSAIKQGVADALDPVVSGLYAFGFGDILAHITLAQSVHGGQVYSCNHEWFSSLPKETQDGVVAASDTTFRQNLAKVPAAFAFARSQMLNAGVKIHTLKPDAMAEFKELGGYQRPEWDSFKKDLLGSVDKFEKLLEASKTTNPRYIVDNV